MKLLLTLPVVLFAFTGPLVSAAPADCEHKIILMPELRSDRNPMHPGPVALSQFLIMHELNNFQGVPVFTDNINEDMSSANFHAAAVNIADASGDATDFAKSDDVVKTDEMAEVDSEKVVEFKRLFPSGVPSKFDDLNYAQKDFIAREGGDVVALMSGRIENLYAAMNGHDLKTLEDRQRKAIGEVNAFFRISPDVKTAIIVTSTRFDAAASSDLFDAECIITPPEIKELAEPTPLKGID